MDNEAILPSSGPYQSQQLIILASCGSKLSLQQFRLTLARDLIQERRSVHWPHPRAN